MKKRVSIFTLCLFVLGCATGSLVYYEPVSSEVERMKPKDASKVSYYMVGAKPKRKYRIVGFASAPLSARLDTPEKCYKAMVKEAARRGADAVVDITYQTDEQQVTRFSGGSVGNVGGLQGYSGSEVKYRGYRGVVVLWEE